MIGLKGTIQKIALENQTSLSELAGDAESYMSLWRSAESEIRGFHTRDVINPLKTCMEKTTNSTSTQYPTHS